MLLVLRHWRSILLSSFICIGALQFGYDGSYFSGVLVITPFIEQFGHLDEASNEYTLSASVQAFVTSIINAGEFAGAASAYYIGDRIGRKKGLYISSGAVVVGTLLQTVPTYIGTLVAGRLLVGYAVGLISCLVPLYIADCAPTNLRGALGAFYQQFIGFGLLLGTITTAATANRDDSGAYRIPMGLQLLFPALLIPGLIGFVPESPRWLMERNKEAEARRSLAKIYGENSSTTDRVFMTLQDTVAKYCDVESSWKSICRWGPEGRKAYLGITISAFQQASGINFITSYGVSFFKALGLNNAFQIQIGLYLIGYPAIWISQYLMERWGRRPMLICSGILMSACLFTIGVCGVMINKYGITTNVAISIVIVVMVYIYFFVFNLGWGPVLWVYTSEISTGQHRGRLMSLSASSNWFFAWLVVFTFPYISNDDAGGLGPSVGFLYGGLVLVSCVWVYFCVPETKGRSLDDIHTMFEKGISARKFALHQQDSQTFELDVVESVMGKDCSLATISTTAGTSDSNF